MTEQQQQEHAPDLVVLVTLSVSAESIATTCPTCGSADTEMYLSGCHDDADAWHTGFVDLYSGGKSTTVARRTSVPQAASFALSELSQAFLDGTRPAAPTDTVKQ